MCSFGKIVNEKVYYKFVYIISVLGLEKNKNVWNN